MNAFPHVSVSFCHIASNVLVLRLTGLAWEGFAEAIRAGHGLGTVDEVPVEWVQGCAAP